MLKLNEHPWNVPDGRMAPGLIPFDRRKRSSFRLMEMLEEMSIGEFISAEVLADDGIACELDVELDAVAIEVFSLP